MDNIEKTILKKHFPEVKPGSNRRYNKDDIMKVLEFMKVHTGVHIKSIAEYSNIALGTLVHWRKTYGKYVGIKVKGANSDFSYEDTYPVPESQTQDNAESTVSIGLGSKRLLIPIELIDQLQKLKKSGINSEFIIDSYLIGIEHSFLYITEKTN